MDDSYIIFECLGGTEKDLVATAVVANLAKTYPERKIVVVSLFPEIWLHNPNVYRVYKGGATPYFHDDYIEGRDTLIFRNDPFNDTAFTKQFSSDKKDHIIKIWSEMVGARYQQKTPELFLTQRELEVAMRLTFRNKPLFFIETGLTGGNPLSAWARNLPIELCAEIARRMTEKGFHVFQLSDDKSPSIPNVEKINLSLRLSLATIASSSARLFSHSILQSASVALKKPSAVVWIVNNPDMYGYEYNDNIRIGMNSEQKKFFDSFSEFYNILPKPEELPTLRPEMFDVDKIMNAILKTSLEK
jgi:hypothetical protein